MYEMGREEIGWIDLEDPFSLENTVTLRYTRWTISPQPCHLEIISELANICEVQDKSQLDLQRSLYFTYIV